MSGQKYVAAVLALLPLWLVAASPQSRQADIVRKAIDEGRITYRLTVPEDVRSLLGPPAKESTQPDGGMQFMIWEYEGASFRFGKMRDETAPFTLMGVQSGGKAVDIGRDRPLVMRSTADLAKMDSFSGLEGVSLARLDLRDQAVSLGALPFDTLTVWPTGDKLPPGFSPGELLESGKNPGLGTRALQAEGLDGRGVSIAIIDQPLLPGHIEYRNALVRYDAAGLEDFPPQMHGPAVLSIAAGKTCGVAPAARVFFFAVAMWKMDNGVYIDAMRKIFALNDSLAPAERIRAVSISTGMFSRQPRFDEWQQVCREAENRGILLLTCDGTVLKYGTLSRVAGGNPDDPDAYLKGRYGFPDLVLRVPAGNRTIASPRGAEAFAFDRMGGMSWGTPYLVGLAALAFQANPGLAAKDIVPFLVETATPAAAGPIVNPRAFLKRAGWASAD